MDRTLYRSAQDAKLDRFPNQYNNQLHQQLTSADKSNFLHVCAHFHDSAEFVRDILNMQSSQVKRSMLAWQNSMGETALHVASRNGRYNIVQLLIQHVGTLDEEDLESGVKIADKMMRATDKDGDTAVHKAVKNNHKHVVELLLEKDPHFEHPMNNMGETPLYLAIFGCYFDVVDSILRICTSPSHKGPHGKTVLHAAVFANDPACISKILQKYPSVTTQADNSGWIPLHYAAHLSVVSSVRTLLNADLSTAYITTKKDHDNDMTTLHIAACQGKGLIMEEILEVCPDNWSVVTSKGQNVLHLLAENEEGDRVNFILDKKWAINLINQKDAQGNTPVHLYLKTDFNEDSVPWDLLLHPLIDWEAINKENVTPLDLLFTTRKDRHENIYTPYDRLFWSGYLVDQDPSGSMEGLAVKLHQKYNAKARTGQEEKKTISSTMEDFKKRWTEKKQRMLQELRKNAETHLLVATLIATVTFAAGFTLPGGYDGNVGTNQGMAVLIKKAAFKMFVVADAIAVVSSIVAVFLHFTATSIDDADKLYNRYISALLLIIIAMITMVIAFVTGLYAVLHGPSSLAISICVLGSFAILVFGFMLFRDAHFLFS